MAGGEAGDPGQAAAAGAAPEIREHLFKVLVIGELGVGKTSIIKRYVHQLFSQHYRATIGVDFALKVLNLDSRTLVRLQLWDIAGQERFGNMTRVYYKEAVGAFVVFDLSRSSTFEAVLKWKSDLDSKVHLPSGGPIPTVLLANKCDQKKEGGQNPSQMNEFCKEHGFTGWFETSAKDNINIDEAARFLVENILVQHQSFPNDDNDVDKIKLDEQALPAESKSQCC
ncbi:ras-related protein Rab-32 [Molossus nigricans]